MVRLKFKSKMRGDTLTEVMFATAVAALVIVLAMSAMNRSFAQTQMSVESTFVRQSMSEQAELLRFIRDKYDQEPGGDPGNLWLSQIETKAKTSASTFGTCFNLDPNLSLDMPTNSFYIEKSIDNNEIGALTVGNTADFERPETYAEPGKGVWVEAVEGVDSKGTSYMDFHIRACWEPPFNGPTATLGTIVRLYYEDK